MRDIPSQPHVARDPAPAIIDASPAALIEAALKPFAAVAALDIGESEADEDTFRNASRDYARAPAITVGDVRRAAEALRAISIDGGEG